MRSYITTPYKDSQEVLQATQGGTGVTTQEEAINVLGVIGNDEKGKPGGIVAFEPGTRFIPQHLLPTSVGVTGKICLEGNRNIPFKGSVFARSPTLTRSPITVLLALVWKWSRTKTRC